MSSQIWSAQQQEAPLVSVYIVLPYDLKLGRPEFASGYNVVMKLLLHSAGDCEEVEEYSTVACAA